MTTVHETLDLPAGATPDGIGVTFVLAGENGYPIAGEDTVTDTTIVGTLPVRVDATGSYSVELTPTDLIVPAGTRWKRTVTILGRQQDPEYAVVPLSGTVDFRDILDAAPGSLLPPGGASSAALAAVDARLEVIEDLAPSLVTHGPLAPAIAATLEHADLQRPRGVWVQGRYAYVVTVGPVGSADPTAFVVIDVADPLNPVVKGSVTDVAVSRGRSVQVVGRYAYMLANPPSSTDYFTVVDVADPTEPVVVGFVSDNRLNSGHGLWIAGGYAYCCAPVASPDVDPSTLSGVFTVIDISDPTAPVIVADIGAVADDPLFDDCNRVAVQGIYAYVSASAADTVNVVDISDPLHPEPVGHVTDPVILDGPRGVAVSGRYLYTCTAPGDRFVVIDVADPTAPVIVGWAGGPQGDPDRDDRLDGARDLFVVGTLAYVVTATADSVTVVDVSDPTAPTVVGYIADDDIDDGNDLDAAHDIYVAGRYAYATSLNGDRFLVLDTFGTNVDALAVSHLHAADSIVADRIEVATGLAVGPQGIFTDGAVVTPEIRAQRIVAPQLRGGRAKKSGGANATAYTVPGVELTSISTNALGTGQVRYAVVNPATAINLYEVAFEVTAAPASNALARIGLYAADYDLQPVGAPLLDVEVAVATLFTGAKTATVDVDLQPGLYVVAWNNDVAFTVRIWMGGSKFAGVNSALGASSFNARMTNSLAYGPFPTPGLQYNAFAVAATPAQNIVLFGHTPI